MEKNKLIILFGGKSSEYEVSLVSAYSVLANIDREKYEITRIGITKKGEWLAYYGDDESIKDNTWNKKGPVGKVFVLPDNNNGCFRIYSPGKSCGYEDIRPDVVFPMLHGSFGEDGRIQGMLSVMGIPTVGCSYVSSAICMDKALTKSIVGMEGIIQADYIICHSDQNREEIVSAAEAKFRYPVFVKPSRAGSSVGISKAHDRNELFDALETAFLEDSKVLLEETITGKEIEVAVLEENGKYTVSCPAEIDVGSNEFYDYETKYVTDDSSFYIPARISDSSADEARRLAKKIFTALGCRGLSRVDFFCREDEKIVFNEINTIPGFTPISMYPKLMREEEIAYSELIDRLISSAMTAQQG